MFLFYIYRGYLKFCIFIRYFCYWYLIFVNELYKNLFDLFEILNKLMCNSLLSKKYYEKLRDELVKVKMELKNEIGILMF